MHTILVIAPHPDDETLGCGGTILKYIAGGSKVYWLICTEFYRHGKTPENLRLRAEEIEKVAGMYGFTERFELGYDAASISYADMGSLVSKITSIVHKIKPDMVFLPNRSDVHTDHQVIFKAGFSCTKHFNFPFIKQVLMYETLSETEFSPALPENSFIPNVYINISGFFAEKVEIMKVYESEVMPPGFPRSLQTLAALAAFRGSSIGQQYAEAFMLLKQIVM